MSRLSEIPIRVEVADRTSRTGTIGGGVAAILVISVAAVQAATIPLASVMFIPLLLQRMAMMSTMESLLMLRLYDWAIMGHNLLKSSE